MNIMFCSTAVFFICLSLSMAFTKDQGFDSVRGLRIKATHYKHQSTRKVNKR